MYLHDQFSCQLKTIYQPLKVASVKLVPSMYGKTVQTFVLSIYQLRIRLEIPSLTIFDSSFCVDFENINLLLFGEVVTEILPNQNKEVILKDKLGCASVKILVWLEFTKAISELIRICSRCSQEATFTLSSKSGQ